jgi:hypothetical protein
VRLGGSLVKAVELWWMLFFGVQQRQTPPCVRWCEPLASSPG